MKSWHERRAKSPFRTGAEVPNSNDSVLSAQDLGRVA